MRALRGVEHLTFVALGELWFGDGHTATDLTNYRRSLAAVTRWDDNLLRSEVKRTLSKFHGVDTLIVELLSSYLQHVYGISVGSVSIHNVLHITLIHLSRSHEVRTGGLFSADVTVRHAVIMNALRAAFDDVAQCDHRLSRAPGTHASCNLEHTGLSQTSKHDNKPANVYGVTPTRPHNEKRGNESADREEMHCELDADTIHPDDSVSSVGDRPAERDDGAMSVYLET